ncbi:uncharacterized protein BDZ99DRAFT_111972 [Mytilinidion resinicola]|uniref:DNA-directed RNA polymerase III subunit RPC9 n=1 Tax=Mytilinidion resinicola TaxID=574789 RepID=A0A6A6Y918_9PEZI|nr:uncharacterized protein BDZ99DRAFT_111972 [Mytilinidion resinicola]KAF2805043.1 hypothetical protein BDZ99DRAFT_111972 [Mytilinidion resinicola]
MKILKAQTALLTNWEVAQILKTEAAEYSGSDGTARERKPPQNLKDMMTGASLYLTRPTHPFNTPTSTYTPTSVAGTASLMARLSPKYKLTKAEYIMLLNLRPVNIIEFEMVVEEAGVRFAESEQWEILDVIKEVLGQMPEKVEQAAQAQAQANGH